MMDERMKKDFFNGVLSDKEEALVKLYLQNQDVTDATGRMYKALRSYHHPVKLASKKILIWSHMLRVAAVAAIIATSSLFYLTRDQDLLSNDVIADWTSFSIFEKYKMLNNLGREELSRNDQQKLISILELESDANLKVLVIQSLKISYSSEYDVTLWEIFQNETTPIIQSELAELISPTFLANHLSDFTNNLDPYIKSKLR
jgi:hypothetical protein